MENHRRIRQQMRMGLRPGILYFDAMCALTGSERPAGTVAIAAAAAAPSDSPQEMADRLRAEVIQLNPDLSTSSTAAYVRKRQAGDLLGYVMAHEITQVLQAVDRHSAEGIMKAHWDIHDRREMIFRRLPFSGVDTELIHAGLGNRR